MSDLTISFEFSLMAAGYTKKEPAPLHPIHKELLDYVNSVEYKKLILKEWDENKIKHNK